MYLKSIELSGFKSFAKKSSFDFGSSISAVSFLLFIFIVFNAFSNYNPLKTISAKNYIGLNKFFKSRNAS